MESIFIQPGNWLVVALVFGLLELGLQLGTMARCPFQPIGDEVEYIERGRSGQPFQFRLFFRLPLLPAVASVAAKTGQTEVSLRVVSVVLSTVAMAATAGATARMGGTDVATVLCVALLIIPERIVLGSRIWPDVYLAAVTSTIVVIFTLTPSTIEPDRSAAVIGTLVMLGVLTRLDALVLIPSVAFTWAMIFPMASPTQIFWLTGPPLAGFAAWWLVSILVFKQRWPDTTWIFNLGIAAQEARARHEGGPIILDDLVQRHQASVQQLSNSEAETLSLTGLMSSIASRLRAMVGPDTFVQGKILDSGEPESSATARSIRTVLLRSSVPLMVAVGIGTFAWSPGGAWILATPALSLAVPAVLLHARTRYRLPVLYGLIPPIAWSISRVLSRPSPEYALPLVAITVTSGVLWWVFARPPRRLERR